MQHLRSLENIYLENVFATIGSFDGVHCGHQELIRRVVQQARPFNAPTAVITFFPHPGSILKKNSGTFYLTMPDERAALLGSLGIDVVITLPFTLKLASLPATEFMQQINQHLKLKKLFTGSDFALGHNREGNTETLRKIGNELGYTLEVIPEIKSSAKRVSSSMIRHALRDGNVRQARSLLGRPYSIQGPVTYGNSRGSKLGVPTANLVPDKERLLPKNGIYATWAIVEDRRFASVTNIGINPTFSPALTCPRIECHILGFDQNIYKEELKIEFIDFIRPEQHFDSAKELIKQIQSDIQNAKEILQHAA